MKKYLIPETGSFYKANLHCHTTFSDGVMTPREVKEYYVARGYSVVAFTDHCVMVPHPELNDGGFLALNGYENEQVSQDTEPGNRRKHCHTCYIALKEGNDVMPYYAPRSIWGKGKTLLEQVKFDHSHEIDGWGYGAHITNRAIARAREACFFVTYNHPDWSVERYADYSQYTGMSAMEIFNYGSYAGGYGDYVPHIYDELLLKGERIYAIATDDNHGPATSCGGWTMIKAPDLRYEAITDALVRGDFYASFGPEIHSLWFEDGHIHITCSEAVRVKCTYGTHRAAFVRAGEAGPVTRASFPVVPGDVYVRLTVVDDKGRCADTNAYFTDTLFSE